MQFLPCKCWYKNGGELGKVCGKEEKGYGAVSVSQDNISPVKGSNTLCEQGG